MKGRDMGASARFWKEFYIALKESDWSRAADCGNILLDMYYPNCEPPPGLQELLQPEILSLLGDVELRRFGAGEVICREGETGDSMFVLVQGRVKVTNQSLKTSGGMSIPLPSLLISRVMTSLINGNKLKLVELTDGAIIGEMALLSAAPRSATVTCIAPTEALEVSKNSFQRVVEIRPELRNMLNEIYIHRLNRMLDTLRETQKMVNSCFVSRFCDSLSSGKKTGSGPVAAGQEKRFAARSEWKDSEKKESLPDRHLRKIERLYEQGERKEAFLEYLALVPEMFRKTVVVSVRTKAGEALQDGRKRYPDLYDFAKQIKPLGALFEKVSKRDTVSEEPSMSVGCQGEIEEPMPQKDERAFIEDAITGCLSHAEEKEYNDGEAVIRLGEDTDSVFVIKEGRVRVLPGPSALGQGRSAICLNEGDIFGEFSFLTGNPRSATVVADGALKAFELDRSLLTKLIAGNPSILDCLVNLYNRRINELISTVNTSRNAVLESLKAATTSSSN